MIRVLNMLMTAKVYNCASLWTVNCITHHMCVSVKSSEFKVGFTAANDQDSHPVEKMEVFANCSTKKRALTTISLGPQIIALWLKHL